VLEIMEIKIIQNYHWKCFFFILRLQSHLTCLSLSLRLLHRKPLRIAWLEIDHSRDRVYPTTQPKCHDLFDSGAMLLVLIPSWRNQTISLLNDVLSFSLSALILSYCISHTYIKHQFINREITCLNRC
jgi:hypothetical protein